MAKFATYASGAIWWPILQLMQWPHLAVKFATNRRLVTKFAINASGALLLLDLIELTESISGSVVPLAMF